MLAWSKTGCLSSKILKCCWNKATLQRRAHQTFPTLRSRLTAKYTKCLTWVISTKGGKLLVLVIRCKRQLLYFSQLDLNVFCSLTNSHNLKTEFWLCSGLPLPGISVSKPVFKAKTNSIKGSWYGGSTNPVILSNIYIARAAPYAWESHEYAYLNTKVFYVIISSILIYTVKIAT